jgi:homocysteine S-methyltransferase
VAPAVQAVGVNCTAPALVTALLRSTDVSLPFVVYPNHGATWDGDHKCWVGVAGGAELPGHLPDWLSAGARLVGGCCGVGAEGIRALAAWRHAHR